jgi:hypothetical protein
MPLSDKQTQLAQEIDAWVKAMPDGVTSRFDGRQRSDPIGEQRGGGDADILNEMSVHKRTFKQVMDLSSRDEMALLREQYAGFQRFGKVLENFARSLQKGRSSSGRESISARRLAE